MALNWVTMVDARPLLLQGESSIETTDHVKCNLTIPARASGTNTGVEQLEAIGTMTLTDQRLIWTTDVKSSFKSLTIPLPSILYSKFEQPIFGTNYLVTGLKPTPGGGLTVGTTLEIRFLNAGMFRFVSLLEKAREKAIFMKRQSVEDEELLPEYTSPSTSSTNASVHYPDLPPVYSDN